MLWELEMHPFKISLSPSPSVKQRIRRYPVRFGTMPPSFMVDKYKITIKRTAYETIESKGHAVRGYVTYGEVLLKINKRLHDYVVNTWKANEPERAKDYIYYQPRLALVERSVVENDVGLKLLKWQKYREEIVKLRFPGVKDLAHEWVYKSRINMSYGDHVKEYVSKHQESHPVQGYTWNQLLKAGLMKRLYDFTQAVVAEWDNNFNEEGDWCLNSNSFNIGMRARSPDKIEFNYHIPFRLDRGRQIGYNPGPSSINAFVPHHEQLKVMRSIFDEYAEQIGCRIISPKTEGGLIYTEIRDRFLEGKEIMHYDVAGMELITPSIINGDVRNFPKGLGMVIGRRGDCPELLSGVGPTSDYDMIAHLELLKKLIKKTPELIVILGDDGTIVGGELYNSVLYERQDKDDKMVRTLGLTCSKYMHPVGRNITVDTADKRINMEKDELIVKNQLTIEERTDIAEYFTGSIRGRYLSDLIGKIKPQSGIYSPREMVEFGLGINN